LLRVTLECKLGGGTLVRRLQRLLLLRFPRSSGGFGFSFYLCARVGIFARALLGFGAMARFIGQRRLGFEALLGECGKLALGLRPGFCGGRGFGFGALALAQRLLGFDFGFGALSRRLLRIALGLLARRSFFDRARFGRGALPCCGVCELFGIEQGARNLARFGFDLGAQLGLCPSFPISDFAGQRSGVRARVGFGALACSSLGETVGFDACERLLLQLVFRTLSRTRSFECFLLRCGARFRGLESARLGGGACAPDCFGAAFRLDTRTRLTLELGFGGQACGLGFQRVLFGCGARFRGFGGAGFAGGARFGDRFGRTICFSASGRDLLRFGLGGEARMRCFHRLLIRDCARLRCGVRFDFSLLARLCFVDGAQIGRDAVLRAKLGLPLHFGALQRESCGVAVGIGPRVELCSARALGCAARACRSEGTALTFRREPFVQRALGFDDARRRGLVGGVCRYLFGREFVRAR
jgi:hypothetical protein